MSETWRKAYSKELCGQSLLQSGHGETEKETPESQMHASAGREFGSSNYSCVDLVDCTPLEDQKGINLHRIFSGEQGLPIFPKPTHLWCSSTGLSGAKLSSQTSF